MLRLLRQMVLAQSFLLVAGCAQLPDYARPQIRMIDPQIAASEQGFSYKRLTLDDFRAIGPPEHLTRHADTINAYSCIQIRPARNSKFSLTYFKYTGRASASHIARMTRFQWKISSLTLNPLFLH